MNKKIKRILYIGTKFKKEFKRQLRMLITFTLGFTIAFTWRETIFNISQSIVNFFLHLDSSNTSDILTSLFITIFCLILIYIASYYLKDSYENY
jgi:hypothetical protein